MENETNIFGRSGQTARTPPGQVNPQANQSHILDPSRQSCKLCSELDNLDMVSCDDCKGWFHFVCARVTAAVADEDFYCEDCKAKKSQSQSRIGGKSSNSVRTGKSRSSTTSSAARRRDLMLARIEEERKLKETRDQEYLDKKYNTLEMFSIGGSTDSELDVDEEQSTCGTSKSYTTRWVNNQKDFVGVEKNVDNQSVHEVVDLVDVSTTPDPNLNLQYSQGHMENSVIIVSSPQQLVQQNRSVLPSSSSNNQSTSLQQSDVNNVNRTGGQSQVQWNFTNPLVNSPVVVAVSIENAPAISMSPATKTPEQQVNRKNSAFQTNPWGQSTVVKVPKKSNVATRDIWNAIDPYESPDDTSRQQFTPIPWPMLTNPVSSGQDVTQSPTITTMQSVNNSAGASAAVNTTFTLPFTPSHYNQPQSHVSTGYRVMFARSNAIPSSSSTHVTSMANNLGNPQKVPVTYAVTSKIMPSSAQYIQVPPNTQLNGTYQASTSYFHVPTTTRLHGMHQFTAANPFHGSTLQTAQSSGQLYTNHGANQYSTVQPNHGANQYSSVPPNFGANQYSTVQPNHGANQYSSVPPNFGANQYSTVQPNHGANQYSSVPPNFGANQYSTVQPNHGANQYSSVSPNFGDNQFSTVPPNRGANQYSSVPPNLGDNQFSTVPPNHGANQYSTTNRNHSSDAVPGNESNVEPATRQLTQSQIAARQVVARKLPVFYGDVEKFPAFIRSFETSTDMCGFTNGENLSRLMESLKGVAMEFVEQQLCYPDDVPQVIETLKLIFGKPEFIIEKLLAKISKQVSPQAEDLSSIIKFSMNVQNICGTIRSAQLTEHLRNPTLMKELVDKLPPSLQLQWACHKQSVPNANLDTLGAWLHGLAQLASSIAGPPKVKKEKNPENSTQKKSNQQQQSKQGSSQNEFINAQIESPANAKANSPSKEHKKCPICNQSSCQRIKDCKKFIGLNINERWSAVKEYELCIRCFGKHRLKGCKLKQKCNVGNCQRAHNPLLHQSEENRGNTANVNCSHQSISRKVDIFRIVPVKLYNNGRSVDTYAYLDDGSNVTTMEDELANELDLESSSSENLCVKWSFGKISKTELISRRVSVQISGVQANASVYDLHNVRTVTDLALPHQTISSGWLKSYKHLESVPITTYTNARPRILIGLQYSKLMVSLKTIEGLWSEPIACKTRLGWVVQGPDGENDKLKHSAYSVNVCECQPDEDSALHSLVKNFFAWDESGSKATNELFESKDIQRARKILDSTTKKIDGRYVTGLLWRFDDVQFPNSYPMALKRLKCLERKMETDPVLATKMCDYIQDFIEKKYVRKLTTGEVQQSASRVWYLPIFPVFNPKKPEKFRVVWDAAAMVNKVSLNRMLLAGPDLLKPLPDVLRRFREKPIAIVGDMKEMFHQVRVIDADVHSQRFLWRDGNMNAEPEIFVIEVLTFGGKNSPCSAQYAKNKNAVEYKNQFPRAVDAIINNHYQDDMLECFDTIDETVRTTKEVKLIHRNGGFEMRNFMSNSGKVLERLGEKIENHQMDLDITSEPKIDRVLGMFWKTSTDTFTFSLKFTKLPEEVRHGIRRPTKREVLSAIMSIFDPLGLIAQFLVYGKILLQKIWRDGTDWDQKISDSSYEHWCTWLEALPSIENIEIPRWYSPKLVATNRKQIQLHIFVDASEEACAAAVYYRIEDDEGIDCCLIGAKTKVAPTKPLSIPRLELQASILGIRLVDNINKCQRYQASERFFWSDSQTVLGWIQSEARKYHQYVAFRIGEILESSDTNEWHWVDTKNNVADDATKWNGKPDLRSSARWYKAPSFLHQPRENWPFGKDKKKFSTDEEMRSVYLLAHLEIPNNNVINAQNFSNWHRLERTMAYALRFIDNLRCHKKDRRIGPFSRDEYNRARITLYKQAQREEFMDEILIIRNNESLDVNKRKELHRTSLLRTCSPYLDDNGLLRVKGRNDEANSIAFNTKRPIILSRQNYITKLLILSFHQKFHHVNHTNTLNQIIQTFDIPALRVALKNVIQNLCQRCKNDKAKPVIPEMAPLPRERLATFARPFTHVGVDFFGPIKVKVRRSPEKRWGVIFTCLTTRAVFIDVAHSLDTSSCIFCIRNFSNRNGKPSSYHSDNGSNFQGAERELREEFQKMNQSKIEETFTDEHTQWNFNPPTASHMGGIWERPIRTIKSVLRKMLPTRLPTDEMLRSYLTEVENIINSTPLTYVQLDNIDDEVLTPNHFLKGSSNGLKSPCISNPRNLCRDDWKAVQEMTNQFWRQFVVEYIPTLTRRTKWFRSVKNLEVGDVVIDCDDNSNRNEWRKAIVEEVAVGKGNQVRRAKVRMIRGEKANLSTVNVDKIKHQSLWRPVAKLAVLDVKQSGLNSFPEAVNRKGNVANASN